MNRNKKNIENLKSQRTSSKIKILDKDLVTASITLLKVLLKLNQNEVRLMILDRLLVISPKNRMVEEFVVLAIHLNDKNKAEIENLNFIQNCSIYAKTDEVLNAFNTSKEMTRKIEFEIFYIKEQSVMKFKGINEDTLISFNVTFFCEIAPENFKPNLGLSKDPLVKLNYSLLEKISNLCKFTKKTYAEVVLAENFLNFESVCENVKNCITANDVFNESAFRIICQKKGVSQQEFAGTRFNFQLDIRSLQILGKKLFKEEDCFYLAFEEKMLDNKVDCIRSHFVNRGNFPVFEIIILRNISIEINSSINNLNNVVSEPMKEIQKPSSIFIEKNPKTAINPNPNEKMIIFSNDKFDSFGSKINGDSQNISEFASKINYNANVHNSGQIDNIPRKESQDAEVTKQVVKQKNYAYEWKKHLNQVPSNSANVSQNVEEKKELNKEEKKNKKLF